MEEEHLSSKKYLQKKFRGWFKEYVAADPPSFYVEAHHSTGDLQTKFHEWFRDPVPADPPFSAKAKRSIGYPLRKLIIVINNTMRMHVEIKHLSIGLFIGMSIASLFIPGMIISPRVAAAQPIDTATPTAYTPTPAPTSTILPPTSTNTPTPFLAPATTEIVPATPTFSDLMIWSLQEGHLSQVGPLELGDQVRVYETSLKYIRPSEYKSRRLGEQINGPGYGAPSNICGPLSIALLQEAGIVNPDLDPHEFWMLNPDDVGARNLLDQTFPAKIFENSRIRVKLDEIDWTENPLYPGDFVYIYAGSGGNFEHMLVVNRVDSRGRAYAVTNHNTEEGFIISEVLLYDPARSDLGMFSTWTVWPNAELGSTGFGGLEVWRLRQP